MNSRGKVAGAAFDAASRTVRKFYEQNPYPRPEEALDTSRDTWSPERRRAEFRLLWPSRPYQEDLSILIAGCGTFQAAKFAMRWPSAHVIGIDFSSRGIEETDRLKRKHGLDNLELHRLSLENAGDLASTFDLIVSTGVLHHLADPPAGLAVLRSVMAPEGAMQVMVYAAYGRAGIYMLQEYCRMLGIGTLPSAIRDLAVTLESLPLDHPLVPLLRDAPDFRSYAGVADALLNPQDRAYTVSQFLEFVDEAGLGFGRWLRQAPYLPDCGAPASSPHAQLLTKLPEVEQFAAMELYRGTMVRHAAILTHPSEQATGCAVDFMGSGWQDYIPVRQPHTVVVEDQLPDGAAAVLINSQHGYADIFLPVDAGEKRLFDAIDGQRSIAQIAGQVGPAGKIRSYFKKLWQYDQVVFDTSRSARP